MSEASFTAINYSLRPSKTIQRGLVFEGLRRLQDKLPWDRAAYIGLGSIWFTDFIMAHRTLGISRMVSLEGNLIGYRRARFNRPYKFVEVKRGKTFDILGDLLAQRRFSSTPLIIWLDYDSEITEAIIQELRDTVLAANDDSVVLVTVDASEKHYGANSRQRLDRLAQLFGERATRALDRTHVTDLQLAQTIGDLLMALFKRTSSRAAKANPFVPAFQIPYKDKASMVTVGAAFPAHERLAATRKIISSKSWPGVVSEPIVAPHLTSKEVAVLQSSLPVRDGLTRTSVRDLGFDLENEQLRAFQEYYKHYPTFAQIIS